MAFKTVILDDEKHCVDVLEILLEQNFEELEIVEKFTSSVDAFEYLKNNKIDLLFTDIQMPFMTGIDLLQKLDKPDFYVIFTTAFDQYALHAIKLSALDYLLKPIDEQQLQPAVARFMDEKGKTNFQAQLQNFLDSTGLQIGGTPNKVASGKIAVSFQDRIVFYAPEQILYCQSSDNYTNIHLIDGNKITASKTIKHFEETLGPMGFLRPHQSYLVNTNYIEQYNKKDGGFIVLKNKIEIPVSRQKKEDVLQIFKNI